MFSGIERAKRKNRVPMNPAKWVYCQKLPKNSLTRTTGMNSFENGKKIPLNGKCCKGRYRYKLFTCVLNILFNDLQNFS